MRRLIAIALLLTTGCASARYEWSSDTGRQCFYRCEAGFHQCRAYCYGNLGCVFACRDGETSCLAACPDLTLVQQ